MTKEQIQKEIKKFETSIQGLSNIMDSEMQYFLDQTHSYVV